MKPAKSGEKLWKRIHVKVIVRGKVHAHKFVAPAGRGYLSDDIDMTRERVIEYLDKLFPHFDFREVQLAPNAFNYVATGLRPQEAVNGRASAPPAAASHIPADQTASGDAATGSDAVGAISTGSDDARDRDEGVREEGS